MTLNGMKTKTAYVVLRTSRKCNMCDRHRQAILAVFNEKRQAEDFVEAAQKEFEAAYRQRVCFLDLDIEKGSSSIDPEMSFDVKKDRWILYEIEETDLYIGHRNLEIPESETLKGGSSD